MCEALASVFRGAVVQGGLFLLLGTQARDGVARGGDIDDSGDTKGLEEVLERPGDGF